MARTTAIGTGAARAAIAAVAVALGAVGARAELVEWDVDETQSSITLTVPDQVVTLDTITATIRMRNQVGGDAGPWNVGNVAAIDGTVATDYVDDVSIEFLTGEHDLFALVSGSYRPNPAAFDPGLANAENPDGQFANTTTAPGAFGARVRATVSIFTVDAARVNFLDSILDVFSPVLPITAGGFDGTALDLGIESALVAFDGEPVIVVGQLIPDSPDTLIFDAFGLNLLPGATVTSPDPTGQPDLRRLTVPVDVDVEVVLNGVPLQASASGTIIANTTLVPEPGVAAMLGSGALLLACLDRRRSRLARARRS